MRVQFARADDLPQIDAIDKLHHEVVQPVRAAEIKDRDDVLVAQSGECPGLSHESFGERRIDTDFRRQDFHCHQSIEARLPCLVDGPHASLAEKFEDLELRKVFRKFLRRWGNKMRIERGRLEPFIASGIAIACQAGLQQACRANTRRCIPREFGPAFRAVSGFGRWLHESFSFNNSSDGN